jgi:putative SOS response-associated peptidase YedK
MCGRYELHSHPAAIALAFGLAQVPAVHPRYNIAPMTDVPIVRIDAAGRRECVNMRWGLVPRWAKDPSIGNRLINARGETIAEKPSFTRRTGGTAACCPPTASTSGRVAGKIRRARAQAAGPRWHEGRRLFAMAGLHERWRSAEGEVLDSCTIVTTAANAALAGVHDRMPVIVAPRDYARWLDPGIPDVADLIAPFPPAAMTWYPVSTRVNAVGHDDASLIESVAMPHDDASAPEDAAEPAPQHPPEQESLF